MHALMHTLMHALCILLYMPLCILLSMPLCILLYMPLCILLSMPSCILLCIPYADHTVSVMHQAAFDWLRKPTHRAVAGDWQTVVTGERCAGCKRRCLPLARVLPFC